MTVALEQPRPRPFIRPCHGSTWAPENRPTRLPATYTRTHGIRYFHGCYSLGDDQLSGVTRRRKGGDHTLYRVLENIVGCLAVHIYGIRCLRQAVGGAGTAANGVRGVRMPCLLVGG